MDIWGFCRHVASVPGGETEQGPRASDPDPFLVRPLGTSINWHGGWRSTGWVRVRMDGFPGCPRVSQKMWKNLGFPRKMIQKMMAFPGRTGKQEGHQNCYDRGKGPHPMNPVARKPVLRKLDEAELLMLVAPLMCMDYP